MTCRICLEPGELIQPCLCSGTAAFVHKECLEKWFTFSDNTHCEICLHEYTIVDVKRKKCRCCPKVKFSEAPEVSATVKLIGIVGLIPAPPSGYFWGMSPVDVFFMLNFVWAILVIAFMRQIDVLVVMTYWKMCVCFGSLLACSMADAWAYLYYDASVCCILTIFTYVYLVWDSQQQSDRHIYIDDTLSNGTPEYEGLDE